MKTEYIYIILTALVLSSCHGKRLVTTNFAPISHFSELNGKYINEEDKLSKAFNVYNYYNEGTTDLVELDFKADDSLIITYADTSGYKRVNLKGKKKKNFFEIYFNNARIYLPPILVLNNINRLRIGKDKEDKLLVYTWCENYGMIPLGAGGSTNDELQSSFSRYDKHESDGLYLTQVGKKWGYTNKKDSIIIVPEYDYALPFKNGIAKVARNKKWGYIDGDNKVVIPLIYDTIMKPEGNIMRVCKNEKWGLIDSLNNEISSLEYDRISSFNSWEYQDSSFYNLAKVVKNNKVGFINKQGVIVIPTEYDEITLYQTIGKGRSEYCRTRVGDKYGYANGNRILCRAVFEKAGENISYNGFSPKNKLLVDKIGRYSEVVYNGVPYLFTERGMLYRYKKHGFFKENRLEVDFDSGFLLDVN